MRGAMAVRFGGGHKESQKGAPLAPGVVVDSDEGARCAGAARRPPALGGFGRGNAARRKGKKISPLWTPDDCNTERRLRSEVREVTEALRHRDKLLTGLEP